MHREWLTLLDARISGRKLQTQMILCVNDRQIELRFLAVFRGHSSLRRHEQFFARTESVFPDRRYWLEPELWKLHPLRGAIDNILGTRESGLSSACGIQFDSPLAVRLLRRCNQYRPQSARLEIFRGPPPRCSCRTFPFGLCCYCGVFGLLAILLPSGHE